MLTNGQKIVAEAEKTLGAIESPFGSNKGHPFIDAAHKLYGLPPNPWCAMAVGLWYHRADVDDSGLIHPFTGFICDRADAMGGLAPGRFVPPGSLLIKCRIHVGLVVNDRRNGLLDTIEGNVSNQVKRLVRAKDEFRIIVPPEVMRDADETGKPAMRVAYGFDDLRLKPQLFGGWVTPESRDARMAIFKKNNPDHWVRPVRVNAKSPYAFQAGERGKQGLQYSFGGWATREIRDRVLNRYVEEVGYRHVRTWSKQVPVVRRNDEGPTGGDESLV